MTINKSAGEVAAISGYDFQYEIFATELYNCLLNHEVEWVEFASAETGKLDDVLIGLDNRVLAYQVKDISSSTFSYTQFTTSDTESILQGAFKGWKKLKGNYPGLPIDARFITTQSVSEHDSITSAIGKPKPPFEKFIRNCWHPVQTGKYTLKTLPKIWIPVIEELAGFVSAMPEEFILFIQDFTFVFDYKLNFYLQDTYTQAKRDSDIDKITKNIFRLVANKGNVKFSRTQFIVEFGLKNQLETHFQHSFFIDEKHYQPILDTVDVLEKVISRKSGGYLALVGNAGSGKSTLLTKWLSDQDYKVLKYYAYTNMDMSYDFGFRGEAELFLHDLLIQIRESKLSLQDRLPESDLLDLQKHFHEELKKLSHCGQKVFIIVDGLDHIDREQKVSKSLIEVLPKPEAIPDNIYIILGSRTIEQLENLSFDITENLMNSDGIVTISPLSKAHILKLTQTYAIELTTDCFDMLCLNTKGHPLFLRYTLEELKSAATEKYEAIIKKNKFSGDIYKEYQKFWNKYKDYDDFIHVLGLISRFRFPYFDTGLLRLFKIKNSDATRVNKVSEFYFYKSENIWQFFHNSFKEFLMEQSSKDRFSGKPDKDVDRNYHFEIADAIKDTENEYKSNQLYHLYKSERYKEVIKLISDKFFRQQWFEFRETSIIFEDIKLASQACFYLKDLSTLTTCFFAFFELEQRARNFSTKTYFKTFLQIGRMDIANSLVFNNAILLVDQSVALEYVVLLFQAGQRDLAKELFERATPTKLLNGSVFLNTRRYNQSNYTEYDEVDIVCHWAVAAIFFMELSAVIDKVRALEVENEEYDGSKKDPFTECLSEITDCCITYKDWGKLEEIAGVYDSQLDAEDAFYFYFDLINSIEKEHPLYPRCMQFFNNWQIDKNNSVNIRYLIIYTLFEKDIEKCGPVMTNIKAPNTFKDELGSGSDNGFSNYVFNYSRLYYIITKDFSVSPESFLPHHEKPAFNAFYLTFAELGRAYAWMFHDYKEASVGFFLGIDRVLGIFHHAFLDPLHEHAISSEKGVLVSSVLRVSSRISLEVFQGVLAKISAEWLKFRRYWRTSEIQQVIQWVAESKLAKDWCSQELELLDTQIFRSGYLDQRLEDGIKQVKLWTSVGEQRKGEVLISLIMSVALDVRGEKDSQLDYLAQWISKFDPIDPQEVQFYFDRLMSVNEIVNSPSHTPALELLNLSMGLGNGFNVLMYLLFEALVEFGDGFESVFTFLFKNSPSMRMVSVKLYSRIILGMDSSHGNRQHFIYEFFKYSPSEAEIAQLIQDVRIYAVMEARNEYLYDIYQQCLKIDIDPKKVGLHDKIERKRDSGNSGNTLRMESGNSFTETQLLEKISRLEDIVTFEALAEKHSYFKWHGIIQKIIPITSENDLEVFIFARDFDSRELIEIGRTLIDHNKKALAKKVLEYALSKSRPSGWVTIYDGGSKIGSFEQLKRIEPKEVFQQVAFKDFAQSITELDINAMEILIKDLDIILALFSDEVDKEKVYNQMKAFRDELLKNHVMNEQKVLVTGSHTNLDVSVEVLHFLITFPSSFAEIIYPVLIQEHESITEIIDQLLSKLYEGKFNLKFVQLLAGLALVDLGYVERNEDRLIILLANERFDIASIAERLLFDLGSDYDLPEHSSSKELPLSYTLELSPKSGIIDANKKPFDHIDYDGYLKTTEDPLIYTQLFRGEIAQLARVTGFSHYNIAYRIMLLGQNAEFPEWCESLSEDALRTMYDGRFRLKIAYKRPQIQKIIAGLNQVVNELFNLDLIDDQTAHDTVGMFDERVYLLEVVNRPEFVPTILSERGSAPSADAKWAKAFETDYLTKVLKVEAGAYFVLAENSTISAMGHGRAVEVRQSFVDFKGSVENKGAMIFNRVYGCLIEDYPYLKEYGVTIYNSFATVNPKETWLAVNPQLAMDMGLMLNENEGSFRWDDDEGNMVIQSIFWQEGSDSNKSTHHDSESGHGWMVLITKNGMKLLMDLIEGKKLFVHRKVERHIEFVQKRFNTYIKEDGNLFETEALQISTL